MSRKLSQTLADQVWKRANACCEYCLIAISDTYFGGEIDHIRSLKHGGESALENLALACQPCNRYKGSDLGSIPDGTDRIVRFYHPRVDQWHEHFELTKSGKIQGISETGAITAKIFRFNEYERVSERLGLMELGSYTSA